MSQFALINMNQYRSYFGPSIVLLLQFVFHYLFNFFVESVKTNTQPQGRIISLIRTHKHTSKPNQQKPYEGSYCKEKM